MGMHNYFKHNLTAMLFLFLMHAGLFLSVSYSATSDTFVLENNYVRFEFEKERLGLVAMIDKSTGTNHFQARVQKPLLWEIALRQGIQEEKISNASRPRLDPPPECTAAKIENLNDGTQRAILEWKNIDWWREKKALDIHVTIDLPKDCGIAQWHINIANRSELWGVWTVKFPYVKGFLKAGVYDVAKPFDNTGLLYKRCDELVKGSYPGGQWGMEFISMNQGTNGIYWAALDAWSQLKDFSVLPGVESFFLNYTEDMGVPGAGYPDFYPLAFGIYRGSWLEASKIYRSWALKQVWTEKGPMAQRQSTPDIMKNVALWIRPDWSFGVKDGAPQEMNKPLLDALNFTGVPVGIHWYNWHHMPFDTEYPHFFPPKPGFRERVRELVDHGVLVMPYINGMITNYDIPDIREFLPFAVRDEAGGLTMSTWGFTSGRTIFMCPYNDFWQDKIVTLVDSLTGYYGVNGVYIDMIGAAAPRLCFNKSHGHPLGGGRWWINGYRAMLEKVQKVAHSNGRNAVISTENTAEPWMNGLDAFLAWKKPDEREIPMLQAVYSGYTYYFTAASWIDNGARAYIMGQGRATIWGLEPGRENFNLFTHGHEEQAQFFKRIGEYRVAARKYLSFGELLGPLESITPLETITELWPTHNGEPKNATLPCAMGALWKAMDGDLGIFLVNFNNEPQEFSYKIDPAHYGLKLSNGQEYAISQILPGTEKVLGVSYPGPIQRTETIPPQDFMFVEIGIK